MTTNTERQPPGHTSFSPDRSWTWVLFQYRPMLSSPLPFGVGRRDLMRRRTRQGDPRRANAPVDPDQPDAGYLADHRRIGKYGRPKSQKPGGDFRD
jgi:hypothetical protein